MAVARVIYFNGTQELKWPSQIHGSAWLKDQKARRWGTMHLIGHPLDGPDASIPITRIIEYKKYPSKHKCDHRCMNAKGNSCECSCGGVNHGISR